MIYLKLLFEFIKIGLFSIGGGLATLPFLNDLSMRTGWFSTEDMVNMLAVSEVTPGAVGINMATYTGYLVGGMTGGVIATIGLIAPPIAIILLINKILERYKRSRTVQAALRGLRPASVALICIASCSVLKNGLFYEAACLSGRGILASFRWKEAAAAIALGILWKIRKGQPVRYILFAGVIGMLL